MPAAHLGTRRTRSDGEDNGSTAMRHATGYIRAFENRRQVSNVGFIDFPVVVCIVGSRSYSSRSDAVVLM